MNSNVNDSWPIGERCIHGNVIGPEGSPGCPECRSAGLASNVAGSGGAALFSKQREIEMENQEHNWLRSEMIQALRQGYTTNGEQECIEQQANTVMFALGKLASEAHTFHILVGYLNDIRLNREREREDMDEGSPPNEEDKDG